MPIKKSAMKALRQAKARTLRNKKVKESITFLQHAAKKAIDQKEMKKAEELWKPTLKAIDKAVQKGILKLNTAARMKSRFMKKLHALKSAK